MIVFREYRDCDFEDLKKVLSLENISFKENEGLTYVALDNDLLIGGANAYLEKDKYFLDYIIIMEEKRNEALGDALLRSMAFYLENKNINYLYFKGSNEYLSKKGFKNEKDGYLLLNIKEFFSNSCKCTGGCNEL